MSPKKIAIALDGSECSTLALNWSLANVVNASDELHLLSVEDHERRAGSVEHEDLIFRKAKTIIEAAKATAIEHQVPESQIKPVALPLEKGVSETLDSYAKSAGLDVVVLGNRGEGSISRAFKSIVGLGSTSNYMVQKFHEPIIVLRITKAITPKIIKESEPHPERRIALAIDETAKSRKAAVWAAEKLIRPTDKVHIVAMSTPTPAYAEVSLETTQIRSINREHVEHAKALVLQMEEVVLQHGVYRDQLVPSIIDIHTSNPEHYGEHLCAFVDKHDIDILVVGSSGEDKLTQKLANFTGIGEGAAHFAVFHAHCAVAVVKNIDIEDPLAVAA